MKNLSKFLIALRKSTVALQCASPRLDLQAVIIKARAKMPRIHQTSQNRIIPAICPEPKRFDRSPQNPTGIKRDKTSRTITTCLPI